jgi:hypothetical protein
MTVRTVYSHGRLVWSGVSRKTLADRRRVFPGDTPGDPAAEIALRIASDSGEPNLNGPVRHMTRDECRAYQREIESRKKAPRR